MIVPKVLPSKEWTIRAILVMGLLAAGCSSEPPRYAVSGVVTIGGKPAPFVVVRFLPADPAATGGGGGTDADGKFAFGADGTNTGLPAGDYRVTFSQSLVGGKPTLAGSGGKAAEREPSEREAVADDYRDPKKTPVIANVGKGSNSFTFDIQAGK